MPIHMTAQYILNPRSLKKCKQALWELEDQIKKNEPGTTLYLIQQKILNPYCFLHTMTFDNEAALLFHRNSKSTQRFVENIYPECKKPVKFIEYNLLSEKA